MSRDNVIPLRKPANECCQCDQRAVYFVYLVDVDSNRIVGRKLFCFDHRPEQCEFLSPDAKPM